MSDTWFASKIAPENDKDDGCHPQEAKVLKAYLRGTIPTAHEAARAITLPVESEPNPIRDVPRLWGLLIDALTELPTSQQKIIDLLSGIKRLPPPDDASDAGPRPPETQDLWRSLLGFGHLWADLHHTQRWRRLINTCSAAERDEFRRDQQTRAAVEAQLVVAGVGDIPLTWGYDCICDALEASEAVLAVEVPAAGEWLKIAGSLIYKDVAAEEMNSALASVRDLWERAEEMSEEKGKRGNSMNQERWEFWKERFRSINRTEELRQGTKDAADMAIKAMEDAEG